MTTIPFWDRAHKICQLFPNFCDCKMFRHWYEHLHASHWQGKCHAPWTDSNYFIMVYVWPYITVEMGRIKKNDFTQNTVRFAMLSSIFIPSNIYERYGAILTWKDDIWGYYTKPSVSLFMKTQMAYVALYICKNNYFTGICID